MRIIPPAARRAAYAILRRCGWEVRRWPHPATAEGVLKRLLSQSDIDLVIDVGANRGQYGRLLRSIGYTGRIVSYEPNPAAYGVLQATASRDDRWEVFCLALGREQCERTLWVPKADDLASLRPVTAFGRQVFAEKIVAREAVNVTVSTLDNEYRRIKGESRRPLLKLDTQGFDLEVLKGADGCLREFCVIQVELSFLPLYEGVARYRDVLPWLESRGFRVSALTPGCRTVEGLLVEADAFLVRCAELEL